MKVLFCASECVPFVKTGGLADVVGSLPKALLASDVDVRVVLPKYRQIDYYYVSQMEHVAHFNLQFGSYRVFCGVDTLLLDGVRFYFIDNLAMFGGDQIYTGDEQEGFRFAFFCRAVLEMLPYIDFYPDVLHCHDWQTGLIPVLLHEQYHSIAPYAAIQTVFTIHNLRFQGLFDWTRINSVLGLNEGYFSPDNLEFYGLLSFMKGGLVFANRITTVSPTYAEEIRTGYYGERLDGLLRARQGVLSGILNGIDAVSYDPATDIQLCAHYSSKALANKKLVKAALQEELGLEKRDVPIIALVTRLTAQKGLDLLTCVLNDLMQMDVQLAIVGMGDKYFQDVLRDAHHRYPSRIAIRYELNEGLARRVYGGSDLYLMPSQFEPCGLSQMIAMRYGTIPIVRETGGLKDSVAPYNQYTDEGVGFSFHNYNAHEMLGVLRTAVDYWFGDKAMWTRLQKRAMDADFSWSASAKQYDALYRDMLGMPKPSPRVPRKRTPKAAPSDVPAAAEPEKPKEPTPKASEPIKAEAPTPKAAEPIKAEAPTPKAAPAKKPAPKRAK